MTRLRSILRRLAAGLAAVTLIVWLAGGAHRGWTKTSVPVEKTDEVTGLTYREYEPRFQPGVDLLAAGLAIAAVLGLATWVVGRKTPPTRP